MFISTPEPPSIGTVITVLLVVAEGDIRAHATVRNCLPRKGMGVEITAMGAEGTARFRGLVNRLLAGESPVARSPVY